MGYLLLFWRKEITPCFYQSSTLNFDFQPSKAL